MKQRRKILSVFFLFGLCVAIVKGQETITVTGGNASNSGGSVSYTVGQILYNTFLGTNGYIVQGVQQPFEISVVTAIENTDDINLKYIIYPNPTSGSIKMVLESNDYENLRCRLYDINGILLRDRKVESSETEISMENLSSSVYFLKVIKNNVEFKVFKIVKR
jgi:hypothetical protein